MLVKIQVLEKRQARAVEAVAARARLIPAARAKTSAIDTKDLNGMS